MSAKDTLRRNKTDLQAVLCGDHRLILNKVHEKNLITPREYNNLKSINREDVEGHVVELVDKIMNKGQDACKSFLDLLQTDEEIRSTLPELKNLKLSDTILLSTPVQVSSSGCGSYTHSHTAAFLKNLTQKHLVFFTCVSLRRCSRVQEAEAGEVHHAQTSVVTAGHCVCCVLTRQDQ